MQNHIDLPQIIAKFKTAQTIDDLLFVLNSLLIFKQSPNHLTNNLLTKEDIVSCHLSKNNYYYYKLPKKNGGYRTIHAPNKTLKKIQKILNFLLSYILEQKIFLSVHGFVKGRSVVTNAQNHCDKKFVFNADLSNFFPTIHFGRIKRILEVYPFELKHEMSLIISNLVCYEGKLPQGSPVSPVLSNAVSRNLDRELITLSKIYRSSKCWYTRYADDITFSANKNCFDSDFLEQLTTIVQKQGFELNPKKIRLQTQSQRQEVTGVIVNKRPNVTEVFTKEIRAILHCWVKNGYEITQNKFLLYHKKNKKYNPHVENYLSGKIAYLRMVRGKDDKLVMQFQQSFEQLYYRQNFIHIGSFLRKWQTNGLDFAMKYYYINRSEKKPLIMEDARRIQYLMYVDEEIDKLSKSVRNGTDEQKNAVEELRNIFSSLYSNNQSEIDKNKGNKQYVSEHNPQAFAEFLNNLRFPNESGLRELVHTPDIARTFDLVTVLETAKNTLKKSKKFIPHPFYNDFKAKIIDLYETEGLKIWEETKQHPMVVNRSFLSKVLETKRIYRFSSEGDWSLRYVLEKGYLKGITEHGIQFSSKFKNFEFLPDDDYFNALSEFFTDTKRVRSALGEIAKAMIQHSNIDGNKDFNPEDKLIQFKLFFNRKEKKTIFEIIDIKSITINNPDNMINGNLSVATKRLHGLCDFSIIANFKGIGSYEVFCSEKKDKILLQHNPLGFTYRFTFYS